MSDLVFYIAFIGLAVISIYSLIALILKDLKIMKLEEQLKTITARYGYTGYGKDYYEEHHKGEDKE